MTLGRVGYNGWGHVSVPDKPVHKSNSSEQEQMPKQSRGDNTGQDMEIIKDKEHYMYVVKEGSTVQDDDSMVGIVNIDGAPHYIYTTPLSSETDLDSPLNQNKDQSRNSPGSKTNGHISGGDHLQPPSDLHPYTGNSFCSSLINLGEQNNPSTFDCIAHWPQLIIAIILYIMLVYLLVICR